MAMPMKMARQIVEGRKTLILGAGGMARELFEIYKALGREDDVVGFCITVENTAKELRGKRIYAYDSLTSDFNASVNFIGAIGNPIRRYWISKLEEKGAHFESAIHPSAVIGTAVEVQTGVIICAQSVLTCDISIGMHSIINVGTYLHHDCKIGKFVTIGPGVRIGGNVEIGENSFIGLGATISHNVKIGKNCVIGAGAVVVSDIPDSVLAYGVPAKVIKSIDDGFIRKIL